MAGAVLGDLPDDLADQIFGRDLSTILATVQHAETHAQYITALLCYEDFLRALRASLRNFRTGAPPAPGGPPAALGLTEVLAGVGEHALGNRRFIAPTIKWTRDYCAALRATLFPALGEFVIQYDRRGAPVVLATGFVTRTRDTEYAIPDAGFVVAAGLRDIYTASPRRLVVICVVLYVTTAGRLRLMSLDPSGKKDEAVVVRDVRGVGDTGKIVHAGAVDILFPAYNAMPPDTPKIFFDVRGGDPATRGVWTSTMTFVQVLDGAVDGARGVRTEDIEIPGPTRVATADPEAPPPVCNDVLVVGVDGHGVHVALLLADGTVRSGGEEIARGVFCARSGCYGHREPFPTYLLRWDDDFTKIIFEGIDFMDRRRWFAREQPAGDREAWATLNHSPPRRGGGEEPRAYEPANVADGKHRAAAENTEYLYPPANTTPPLLDF